MSYSFRILPEASTCFSCEDSLEPGFAGHYFERPLCSFCLAQAAPDLVDAAYRAFDPAPSIHVRRTFVSCAECGRTVSGPFLACHRGQTLCRSCLPENNQLALLLLLAEASASADLHDIRHLAPFLEAFRTEVGVRS